jgi:hypothetical protein
LALQEEREKALQEREKAFQDKIKIAQNLTKETNLSLPRILTLVGLTKKEYQTGKPAKKPKAPPKSN